MSWKFSSTHPGIYWNILEFNFFIIVRTLHGIHTCTPHLFDEDLTVHNQLHNTRKIMHTQCHAWFHDIVRIWVRPICL